MPNRTSDAKRPTLRRAYVDRVPSDQPLLTTAELAKKLGLTPRTIQKYRSQGLLTPAEESIGGHARWIEEDVREQMRVLREHRRQQREN
jgi:predicted DNA-binding transcriptional regulator AlpA